MRYIFEVPFEIIICQQCPCKHRDRFSTICHLSDYGERRNGNCPLLPLPDSHGDLIDRKALSDAIGKVITDRDRMIGTYDTIEQIIDEAETIVEATNE